MPELMLVAEGRRSGEAAEASRVFFGCTYIYWEPCLIFWLGGASQILFAVHTCFFWFGRPIAASWMLSVHPRPLKHFIPGSYLN